MKKMNRVVSANELMHIPVTYEGTNYQPVLHREAIDSIKEQLDKYNFKVTSEQYLAASNGQRVIGRYGIQYNDEFNYMIGFANSHDGSIAFKYFSGSEIRVCSNGAIWGTDYNYRRKHVGEGVKDLIFGTIHSKLNSLEQTMKQTEENAKRMKEIEVDRTTISKLVGEAFLYEEMIKATQLSIIKKEIANPSFDYAAKNSLWELYNHFTYAVKESTPTDWLGQHTEISDYFVNAAGILEKKGEIFSPAKLVPQFEAQIIEALEEEMAY